MSTAGLHVIGSTHETRFGESFDAYLHAAIGAARDPGRGARELDELGLLTVLAHFAAAGDYQPESPTSVPGWGLEVDPGNPRFRHHRFAVHYSAGLVTSSCSVG